MRGFADDEYHVTHRHLPAGQPVAETTWVAFSMSRLLVALPAIGSLAAIAGAAASMLSQVSQPGSAAFIPIFFGGVALPYLVTLALLTLGDGRGGVCLAAGTAAINALWSVPLAACSADSQWAIATNCTRSQLSPSVP
jgi:hypothetical protein